MAQKQLLQSIWIIREHMATLKK